MDGSSVAEESFGSKGVRLQMASRGSLSPCPGQAEGRLPAKWLRGLGLCVYWDAELDAKG